MSNINSNKLSRILAFVDKVIKIVKLGKRNHRLQRFDERRQGQSLCTETKNFVENLGIITSVVFR